MIKRVTSYILISFLIISCLVVSTGMALAEEAGAGNDIAGTKHEQVFNMLSALGILSGDGQGNFMPESNVTKAEMSAIISRILSYGVNIDHYKESKIFTDVPSDHWAAADINMLASIGYIDGNPDGTFGPSEVATWQQVSKVIVNLLGYGQYVKAKEENSSAYIAKAAELGVFKGIDTNVKDKLQRYQLAQMIYNSLDIPILKHEIYGDENTYAVNKNKTLLTEYMKISKDKGIITANSITTLTCESSLQKNEVEINGEIYKTGKTNAEDLVGYNVIYYYKEVGETRDNELVYIKPEDAKNKVLSLNAELVCDQTTKTRLYYYEHLEDSNTNTADISPVACMIYNGKAYPDFTARDLKPKSGDITLVDNDSDGLYDVVIVNEQTIIVFDSIVMQDKYIIRDIIDSSRNLIFDPNKTEVNIYKENVKIEAKDLSQWDILSVRYSTKAAYSKPKITIYVVNIPVGGEISESNDDEVVISGIKYKISECYKEYVDAGKCPALNAGKAGTFYLDMNGEIVAFKEFIRTDYAYFFKSNRDHTLENNISLKLYTYDNKFVVFKASKSLTIDDVLCKDYDAFQKSKLMKKDINGDYVDVKQLIKYKLNDKGEVQEIKTAQDYTSISSLDARRQAANNNIFRKSTQGQMYYRGAGSFEGKVYPNAFTKVFVIPGDDTKETAYQSQSVSYFAYDVQYDIISYDESLFNVPQVIVVKSGTTSGVAGDDDNLKKSSFLVVKNVVKAIVNDEAVLKIVGLRAGNEVSIPIATDYSVPEGSDSIQINDLQSGDVLQVGQDSEGYINYIKRWYTKSQGIYKSATSNDYRQNWRSIISGVVLATGENGMYIIVDDTFVYTYDLSRNPIITLCDLNNKSVIVASPGDILEGDFVVIRIRETGVHEVVIIRGINAA